MRLVYIYIQGVSKSPLQALRTYSGDQDDKFSIGTRVETYSFSATRKITTHAFFGTTHWDSLD